MKDKTKILHIKVMDGTKEDIASLRKSLIEFKENIKNKLPYDIEFLITNQIIELTDINNLIIELYKLKKQIEQNKRLRDKDVMPNMPK